MPVAACEFLERQRCRGRDRIEYAEKRMRIALRVASDQIGIVEVIARIHLHAGRQSPPHGDLLAIIQQRNLDAVDLALIVRDHTERGFESRFEFLSTPIALERRIEHVAQPVQDDRLIGFSEHAGIDRFIVGLCLGDASECAARHQDDASAELLDRMELGQISGDDIIEGAGLRRIELFGAAS